MAINKPPVLSTDVWADNAGGGDNEKPPQASIDAGWAYGARPPHKHFNWYQNQFSQLAIHNNERGVNEWDAQTEYQPSAICLDGDMIYRNISGVTSTNEQPSLTPLVWTEFVFDMDAAAQQGQRKNYIINGNFLTEYNGSNT